jgi:hypothetical protein
VNIGRGFRQGCSVSLILFNLYSEYITKVAIEGFDDLKIGQVILTMKYADILVLLSEEKAVLRCMFERLNEIGK